MSLLGSEHETPERSDLEHGAIEMREFAEGWSDNEELAATRCSTRSDEDDGVVPVVLEWRDLDYSVYLPSTHPERVSGRDGWKVILSDVNGWICHGQCCLILGPSGSGKTSFINVLAQRVSTGMDSTHDTKIKLNGRSITASEFIKVSGYVTQDELFLPTLTVQETMEINARLRLPGWNEAQRLTRINDVLAQLKLSNSISTQVGDSTQGTKGLSGGELRRLAIAVEIINPSISILILDEPTSGLDAAAALTVTSVLRNLADSGMAVISTIHQPRQAIFQQFDRVLLLVDGHMVYFGEREGMMDWFMSTHNLSPPPLESATDWLLDVMAGEVEAPDALALEKAFKSSSLYTNVVQQPPIVDTEHNSALQVRLLGNYTRAGIHTQFKVLFWRDFLATIRDRGDLVSHIGTTLFLGLVLGFVYWDITPGAPR